MNKSIKQTFTCVGINNVIPIIQSKKFQIVEVLILKNSKAEKDKKLNDILKFYGLNKIKKVNDIKGSQSFKTQGVSITFSGKLIYKEILVSSKKENVSFLVLDQIEDPQNFGQIIRTVECAGINGIIYPKHHSTPLNETVLQVSQGAFVNMKFYEVTNIRNELNKLKKTTFGL